MIDQTDRLLLHYLQENSRLTSAELATKAGLSTSSCWRRIKSLEEIGAIKGYSAIVDRRVAGFDFSAIIHVTLSRQEENTVQQFTSAIAGRPEIQDCFATTGDADYHLRVVVRDLTEYNRFLDEVLFRIPGVAQVRSNVILKDIKTSQNLPHYGDGNPSSNRPPE